VNMGHNESPNKYYQAEGSKDGICNTVSIDAASNTAKEITRTHFIICIHATVYDSRSNLG